MKYVTIIVILTQTLISYARKDTMEQYQKPKDEILKQQLSDMQYNVTQCDATEPAFHNKYWNNKKHGLYVDIISGQPLFSSLDKFDSGSGWPSFTQPLEQSSIKTKQDYKIGYARTEVRSSKADSHLGHVFNDGPGPNGLRYCINSSSLDFIPVNELAARGYGEYLEQFKKAGIPVTDTQTYEKATLAGGCFWGMEEILRAIPGVIKTDVGYTGGDLQDPVYTDVKTGSTGHAEAVEVTFDPTVLSYANLLSYFFRMHDPTTKNRQGNDIGTQYRSVIFYHSKQQQQTAQKIIEAINASKKWKNPIVTEVVPASPFYTAEEFHQDYLQKHPDGYTCHFLRE